MSASALRSRFLAKRQTLQLQQRDAQHAAEGEAGGEAVRDAQAGTEEIEEIERRLAARQDIDELARQVLAIIGIEVQRLQVIAEMHRAQSGRAASELGQRDAQLHRAE